MSLEQAILEEVRALPVEKQQEIPESCCPPPRRSGQEAAIQEREGPLGRLGDFALRERDRGEPPVNVAELSKGRYLIACRHGGLLGGPSLIGQSGRRSGFRDSGRGFIHVPSICLIELTCLVEKGRLPVAARKRDRRTPAGNSGSSAGHGVFAKTALDYSPSTARRSRTAASNRGMSRSTIAQTKSVSAPSYSWIRTLRRSFISRQGIAGCAARKSAPTFREASPMISRFRQTALKRMETGTLPCSRRP